MDAADPATRAALAFVHLVLHDHDVFRPGLRFGAGDCPTYPLIACERRDVFPSFQHFFIGQDRFAHIGRQLMHRTACQFLSRYHVCYCSLITRKEKDIQP